MKRIIFISISFFFLVFATAFTQKQQTADENAAVYKLMEVSFLWDLLKANYEPDRDRDATWLDVGFRSKYAMAKKYASLELLKTAFGEPVFVIGPHDKDMNFNDPTSFGHYNPEFITKLERSIKDALQNPLYRETVQNLYAEHLASMANTYHAAYLFLHQDKKNLKKLTKEYNALIDKPEGSSAGSFQEVFRDFAEGLEKSGQGDVYEGFTAPAFWLRRSIDGTDKQLFGLLEMVRAEMEKVEEVEEYIKE